MTSKTMRGDLAQAVQLVRTGKTFSEAARTVGVSRSAVAGACHRAKVRSQRPPYDGSKTARIVALYLDGVPCREIAARCGLGEKSNISSYLRFAGVSGRRRQSEGG